MSEEHDGKDSNIWRDALKHCSALTVVVIGLAWYWLGTKEPPGNVASPVGVIVTFIGLVVWIGVMLSTLRR
jgi:hypothetical protein